MAHADISKGELTNTDLADAELVIEFLSWLRKESAPVPQEFEEADKLVRRWLRNRWQKRVAAWGGRRPGAGRKRSGGARCCCGEMTLVRAQARGLRHTAWACETI